MDPHISIRLATIEDIFSIEGRGTVVTGKIERGVIKVGEEVEIVGIKATQKSLKKGDRISLVGFGSFSVAKRAARVGRNPQTGKPLNIKAKKVVKFKAGSDLASIVDGGAKKPKK